MGLEAVRGADVILGSPREVGRTRGDPEGKTPVLGRYVEKFET